MSLVAPSHLLFTPSSPSCPPITGVESIRRLHNDRSTLIIDTISIRKRALNHRSRSFLGVYFGENYPLNTAYDIRAPYYRSKEESILALSAILAALKQLLIGLSNRSFADKYVGKVIIRTNCKWAVHVLSSRASQREAALEAGRSAPTWDDNWPQNALAKRIEDSIELVMARRVRIQFWIMGIGALPEARMLAEMAAAKRSKLNLLEFKIWVGGVGDKCRCALRL